jgi:hypothetical protein
VDIDRGDLLTKLRDTSKDDHDKDKAAANLQKTETGRRASARWPFFLQASHHTAFPRAMQGLQIKLAPQS